MNHRNVHKESNKHISVELNNFNNKTYIELTKVSTNASERETLSQRLINELCEYYNIEIPIVNVPNSRQIKTTNGKILGTYKPHSKIITVPNKTAKLGKIVAIKSFIDTLLHEFIHHYDYFVLELSDSLHTAGFYQRISDLKNKLEN